MIYTQIKNVGASLTDANANLSPIGAMTLVEDNLTELFKQLKIDGLTTREKYGAVWVFLQNHIKFIKTVRWQEQITLASFISYKSALRICVDTCIKNSNQEIVAYSRIQLCSIDTTTQRPRRTDTVGIDDTVAAEKPMCDIDFAKPELTDMRFIKHITIRSSNIDYAHHTNNIEYVRFLINTFSVQDLLNKPVREIDVQYKHQSFENDAILIFGNKTQNTAIFEIRKDSAQLLVCEMRF